MQRQDSTRPLHDDEVLRGMEAARRLIGFFPIGAASDPKIFETGLCELLAAYPQWVLDAACNVRSGLPAHHTFLPSIAEIRQFCDKLVEDDRRHRETLERYGRPALSAPVDRSNRPTYDELKAKYGPNWGINSMEKPHAHQKTPPQRTPAQTREPERKPDPAEGHAGQERWPGAEIDLEF